MVVKSACDANISFAMHIFGDPVVEPSLMIGATMGFDWNTFTVHGEEKILQGRFDTGLGFLLLLDGLVKICRLFWFHPCYFGGNGIYSWHELSKADTRRSSRAH